MIRTIDYKDWFLNQKRIPDKESVEFDAFFEFHKELCLDGFYMEGEFFNPFLYWHLNIWHTEVDVIDELGRIQQKYANPFFRDNEWIVTNEIHKANMEKKGLAIGGIRRLAKSVIESSYIGWGATFDENSQNVISGLNSQDIKLITDKIDKGLNYIPEAWRWQRIEDNWKNQVTLGVKTRNGERIPFSAILIRNLDDGNNEEAIAGTKPRKLIIDEAGKGNFLKGLQAAIPGFTTPYGWGCSPIITFTGGDMKKFMDAKSLFFDVNKFNFLSYNNKEDSKRVHGLFIGAKYRLEGKIDSSLGIYLEKPEDHPFHQIPMKVSDEEKALKITQDEIETARKAGDKSAYLKAKMYYPIEVDDIFLNEDTNIFKIEAAKKQQARIKALEYEGMYVELYHDGESIKHKLSNKLPITEFPVRSQSKDAPIVVWETPIHNPPFGLYVAGVDSYRQGKSKYSTSLGAVYIFKRMHDITSEKFQDMFVAAYVARPEDKAIWDEQARLLIKWYNAYAMVENDELSFIDYMKHKGDAIRHLAPQPLWGKEIGSYTNREYGLSRSAEKARDYLHTCLKKYLDDTIRVDRDEEGSVIKEYTGVTKIYDTMLLEEIINYNEVDNFDRIVAAELAITTAMHLDPIVGKISSTEMDPRLKALFNKEKNQSSHSLFNKTSNTFTNPKRRLFSR